MLEASRGHRGIGGLLHVLGLAGAPVRLQNLVLELLHLVGLEAPSDAGAFGMGEHHQAGWG